MTDYTYRVSYDIDIPEPDMEQVVNMSFSGCLDDYEKIRSRAKEINTCLHRGTLRSSYAHFSECTSLPRRFEEPDSKGKLMADGVPIEHVPAYISYLGALLDAAPDIGLRGKIYMKHPYVGRRNIYDVEWEHSIGSKRGCLNVTQDYAEEWNADTHVPWPKITGGSSVATSRPRTPAATQSMSSGRLAPVRCAPASHRAGASAPHRAIAPRKKMGYDQTLAIYGESDNRQGSTLPQALQEIAYLCLHGQVDISYLEWAVGLLGSWTMNNQSERQPVSLGIMERIYRTQLCRTNDPDTRELMHLLIEDFLEEIKPEQGNSDTPTGQLGMGCAVLRQDAEGVHALEPQEIVENSPETVNAVHIADTVSHTVLETRLSIVKAFQTMLLSKIDQERIDADTNAKRLEDECKATRRQIEQDRADLRKLRDSGECPVNTERDISLWIESTRRELSAARKQHEQAVKNDVHDCQRITELNERIDELRRGALRGAERKEAASKLSEITQLREQRITYCDALSLEPAIDELSSRLTRYQLLLDQSKLVESHRKMMFDCQLVAIEEREGSLALDELKAEEARSQATRFANDARKMSREIRMTRSRRVYWGSFRPLAGS